MSNSDDFQSRYHHSYAVEPRAGDQHAINAATAISQYVDKIYTLQQGMDEGAYKAFNSDKARELGVLLFGKFAVEDLIKSGVNAEAQPFLKQLDEAFQSLYLNLKKTPLKHVNALIDNANLWLKLPNDTIDNKEQAEKFCRSLHTILTIIQTRLSRLKGTTKFAVNLVVNTDTLSQQIGTLLTSIEKRSNELKADIAATPAPETLLRSDMPLQDEPQSLQEHLNAHFLQTSASNAPEEEKLTALENQLSAVIDGMSELITKRHEKVGIELTIQAIAKPVPALKPDLSLSQPSTDAQPEKRHLPPAIKKVYRMLFPKKEQTLPETALQPKDVTEDSIQNPLHSHSIAIAENPLINLKKNLAEKNLEIQGLQEKISKGNAPLAASLTNTSISELEAALTTIKSEKEAVVAYKKLANHIKTSTEKIKWVDGAIKKHDDWKVILSNLLAKLLSFFKTDTAIMIDEARQYIGTLASFKKQCETELAAFATNDTEHPILKQLGTQLGSAPSVPIDSAAKFKAMQKVYKEMIEKPPEHQSPQILSSLPDSKDIAKNDNLGNESTHRPQ